MGYFLGIDVGASHTVAAVARPGGDVETVDLGGEGGGVASVLHLGEDGLLSVGAEAEGWGVGEPDRVVRGFPGRIGDGEPMVLAGEPWAPEELTAWLVRWVVERVAQREGGPADGLAVTCPPSWDATRRELLAAAVAEQDLAATFPDLDASASDEQTPAARAAAALRDAAPGARPTDDRRSGRHPVAASSFGSAAEDRGRGETDGATTGGAADGPGADHLDAADGDGSERGDGAATSGGWDVPAPRSPSSGSPGSGSPSSGSPSSGSPSSGSPGPGAREPDTHDLGGGSGGSGSAGEQGDPTTANFLADLVGFTGGMGAMNTAGLLSGYTPPHEVEAWSGQAAATRTAAGEGVTLPEQRAGSGGWQAVEPDPDARTEYTDYAGYTDYVAGLATEPEAAPAPVRARNNPAVLVGAGGLAAALAVVGTLVLWPGPGTANSAETRPIPAVSAPTAPVTVTVTATPTVEPEPTRRPRPTPPRTRRPVVPLPPTVPGTTVPATATGEPTDTTEPAPTTGPPPSDETEPPTSATEEKHD